MTEEIKTNLCIRWFKRILLKILLKWPNTSSCPTFLLNIFCFKSFTIVYFKCSYPWILGALLILKWLFWRSLEKKGLTHALHDQSSLFYRRGASVNEQLIGASGSHASPRCFGSVVWMRLWHANVAHPAAHGEGRLLTSCDRWKWVTKRASERMTSNWIMRPSPAARPRGCDVAFIPFTEAKERQLKVWEFFILRCLCF